LAALAEVEAQAYSLGQPTLGLDEKRIPSITLDPELGEPNTFIFGLSLVAKVLARG